MSHEAKPRPTWFLPDPATAERFLRKTEARRSSCLGSMPCHVSGMAASRRGRGQGQKEVHHGGTRPSVDDVGGSAAGPSQLWALPGTRALRSSAERACTIHTRRCRLGAWPGAVRDCGSGGRVATAEVADRMVVLHRRAARRSRRHHRPRCCQCACRGAVVVSRWCGRLAVRSLVVSQHCLAGIGWPAVSLRPAAIARLVGGGVVAGSGCCGSRCRDRAALAGQRTGAARQHSEKPSCPAWHGGDERCGTDAGRRCRCHRRGPPGAAQAFTGRGASAGQVAHLRWRPGCLRPRSVACRGSGTRLRIRLAPTGRNRSHGLWSTWDAGRRRPGHLALPTVRHRPAHRADRGLRAAQRRIHGDLPRHRGRGRHAGRLSRRAERVAVGGRNRRDRRGLPTCA